MAGLTIGDVPEEGGAGVQGLRPCTPNRERRHREGFPLLPPQGWRWLLYHESGGQRGFGREEEDLEGGDREEDFEDTPSLKPLISLA